MERPSPAIHTSDERAMVVAWTAVMGIAWSGYVCISFTVATAKREERINDLTSLTPSINTRSLENEYSLNL